MKFPIPVVFLTASVVFTGCNSLDNPVGGMLDTGRDARVYNAQTGEFEWPKDSAKPRPRSSAAAAALASAAPAAPRQGDGRYYDAQKNEWIEAREERVAPAAAKSRPSSRVLIATPTPLPMATPPPPQSKSASGVYNPSSGRIEWNTNSPERMATPAPRKSWWWPF